VGKVWQVTACDAASSYGLAMVFLGNPHSAVTARFLRRVVRHLSFPTSMIPPDARFSHGHDPTRVVVFSRP